MSDIYKSVGLIAIAFVYDDTYISGGISVLIFVLVALATTSSLELLYMGILCDVLMVTFGATPLWDMRDITVLDWIVVVSLKMFVLILAVWRYWITRSRKPADASLNKCK